MTEKAGWLLLGLSVVLLAWLSVESIKVFAEELSRRASFSVFAVVLFAAGAYIAPHASEFTRAQHRQPIACGNGADIDSRDGLCYRNGEVPGEFQRR